MHWTQKYISNSMTQTLLFFKLHIWYRQLNTTHLCDTVPHSGRALFAGRGRGHSGCCLHDCGGHISQWGGGGGVSGEH